MTNTKDIIIQLKEVRKEKNLSYGDIMELIEKNGDYLSKSTLSRLFAEGSENDTFSYEGTIQPLAKALLDIEEIEEDDNTDTKAIKSIMKYKMERIKELEQALEKKELELAEEKVKHHEKLDAEREEYKRRTQFLINQIDLKDKRMDQLLEAVFKKDAQHIELLDTILSCPARKQTDCGVN